MSMMVPFTPVEPTVTATSGAGVSASFALPAVPTGNRVLRLLAPVANTAPIFVALRKENTTAADATDMPINQGGEINLAIGPEITHIAVFAAAAQVVFATVGQGGI